MDGFHGHPDWGGDESGPDLCPTTAGAAYFPPMRASSVVNYGCALTTVSAANRVIQDTEETADRCSQQTGVLLNKP